MQVFIFFYNMLLLLVILQDQTICLVLCPLYNTINKLNKSSFYFMLNLIS